MKALFPINSNIDLILLSCLSKVHLCTCSSKFLILKEMDNFNQLFLSMGRWEGYLGSDVKRTLLNTFRDPAQDGEKNGG
jgi:hypothetical protein